MARGEKVRLTEQERERLAAVLKRDTPAKVAQRWQVNDTPLLRAANGYEIQRGTRALIEAGLAKEEK